MRRVVAILFLLRTLWKERCGRGSARFLLKSFGVSTDELCRIADSIDRFGLDNLLCGGRAMAYKRKYIWAYLDGKRLVEVIQAALDNNMMVDDLKRKLIAENPGHEVTFKVETK